MAIALALCAEPELIIADEPTTALDVSVQAQVIRVFQRVCRERGMAAMLITHDMGVIAEAADRVTVMYRGQVLETGPVRQILHAPARPYTRALMAAIPSVHRRLHRLPVPEIGQDVASGTAPVAAAPEPVPPAASGAGAAAQPVLLKVDGLAREFDLSAGWLTRVLAREPRKVLRAVDGVSLEIRRGTTYGLVGESGSGKSTVARMVAGLLQPTEGRVWFDGIDRWAGGHSGASMLKLRRRFQMIFQDPYASLNPRWRVEQIIAEPLEVLGLTRTAAETRERVAEALSRVRLPADVATRYPHQFSGGQRQRIAIARALVSKPDFIVCDEPTSSLDVSVQAQVLNLMRDLQDEFGLTYLLISHNLAAVSYTHLRAHET